MKLQAVFYVQGVIVFLIGYWWYVLVLSPTLFNTNELKVHFLNVGQGDAVLIEIPGGQRVLVDAGRGSVVLSELDKFLPRHHRFLDLAIMTHPDTDHIGGFVSLLDRYDVGTIFQSHVKPSDDSLYNLIHKVIDEQGITVYTIDQPYTFSVGAVQFSILWPIDGSVKETNAASIVLLVSYGDIDILLTGDANKAVEEYVVTLFKERLVDVEILKIGHHGSKTATSPLLLRSIRPGSVIYSAAKDNRYGQPHQEVYETVREYDSEIKEYWTWDGTVSFCATRKTVRAC